MKCPLTAPAKSSKSRVSKMALISSLSQKMSDNSMKVKPLSKVAATPIAKVKQSSSVSRALTTPRNQRKVSNIEPFRTVQSKKAVAVVVPKNRVVAKALVFHSPRKAVKIKSSIELNTPVKALCSAMQQLELNGVKKNGEGSSNKPLPAAASRKQFRGREVKSRVFDSLYSNTNRKGTETNSMRNLKEKVKNLQKGQVTVPHEEAENESSDMEIDEKSRGGSLETSVKSQEESSVLVLSETSGGHISLLSSSEDGVNKTTEESENEERRNPVSKKGVNPEDMKRKDKENSMASDHKENEGEPIGNDDKENASAPDENRVQITHNDNLKKAIIRSKHEDSRKTPKKSTSTAPVYQVVKYRKLKPTNPKPFKLRTDERGILKEANLEKKLHSPLKETTAKGGKEIRKYHNVNGKTENCPAPSEQDTDNLNSSEERSDQTTQEDQSGSILSAGFDNSNGKVQQKLSATTPDRNLDPKLQKPIDLDNQLEQDKGARRLDDNIKRKPQMMRLQMQHKFLRPQTALSRKKEKVFVATPGRLSEKPKEASKPCNNDASLISKVAGSTYKPCSRGRRALTVPKEPKFQSLHVPKSCTRKLT